MVTIHLQRTSVLTTSTCAIDFSHRDIDGVMEERTGVLTDDEHPPVRELTARDSQLVSSFGFGDGFRGALHDNSPSVFIGCSELLVLHAAAERLANRQPRRVHAAL